MEYLHLSFIEKIYLVNSCHAVKNIFFIFFLSWILIKESPVFRAMFRGPLSPVSSTSASNSDILLKVKSEELQPSNTIDVIQRTIDFFFNFDSLKF